MDGIQIVGGGRSVTTRGYVMDVDMDVDTDALTALITVLYVKHVLHVAVVAVAIVDSSSLFYKLCAQH